MKVNTQGRFLILDVVCFQISAQLWTLLGNWSNPFKILGETTQDVLCFQILAQLWTLLGNKCELGKLGQILSKSCIQDFKFWANFGPCLETSANLANFIKSFQNLGWNYPRCPMYEYSNYEGLGFYSYFEPITLILWNKCFCKLLIKRIKHKKHEWHTQMKKNAITNK